MARQPTIKDVALRAGVSFKTVSRVLNGEPHVREALKDRITAAVAELGYRPNVAARGLIGAPSRLIGFLFDNPNFGYVAEAELGTLLGCREAGYFVAVESLDNSAHAGRQIEQILSSLRVDGLILTPPISDNPEAIAAIERLGVRYVLISPQADITGAASIRVDDEDGAWTLTRRLLDLGHRRIGFVEGPPDHGASHLRLQGYRRAMAEGGGAQDPDLVVPGAFTLDSGLHAGRALLALPGRPTAIFASNDQMAFGVIAAARERGLEIPGDLSVAGFDDTRSARMSSPPLTTVRQPIADMCSAAVGMLIAAASGDLEPSRALSMATELVERGSTAPL